MQTRLLTAFTLALAVAAAACSKDSSSTPSPTMTGVVVTGNGAFTSKNATSQLTATANFSDGATQNVTNSAAWSSSSPAVASVSSTGLVTALGHGNSTISASHQGSIGSLAVLVSLKAVPEISGNFQRLCGPFRARLEVTLAETGRSIGYDITSLTLTMRDIAGNIRASKTYSAADLIASSLGTNHINPDSSKVLVYEASYSPAVDTEDSKASIQATITDDAGTTQTITVSPIAQRDRC